MYRNDGRQTLPFLFDGRVVGDEAADRLGDMLELTAALGEGRSPHFGCLTGRSGHRV